MKTTSTRITFSGLLCSLVLLAVAASCTTVPKLPEPRINIAIVQPKDLTNGYLGMDFNENPYLAPKGIVTGQKDEFIVLKIELANLVKQDVEFQFSALSPEGVDVAVVKNPEDMQNFWSFWDAVPDLNKQRDIILKQTYLQSDVIRPAKALETWYVVMMGKNPIPKPATVTVKVFIGAQAPQKWEFPLIGIIKK